MNNDLLGILVIFGFVFVFCIGTLGKPLYDYITFYTKSTIVIHKEAHEFPFAATLPGVDGK